MIEQNQIDAIILMLDQYLANNDCLVSSRDILLRIRQTLIGEQLPEDIKIEDPDIGKIILTCITSTYDLNEGFIAAVIQRPNVDLLPITKYTRPTKKDHFILRLEYEAIYTALTTFCNLVNSANREDVIIRSSNLEVIQQLKKEIECPSEAIKDKRDAILELVSVLPMNITFQMAIYGSLTTHQYLARLLKDFIKKFGH
jgi:hypothetical protein